MKINVLVALLFLNAMTSCGIVKKSFRGLNGPSPAGSSSDNQDASGSETKTCEKTERFSKEYLDELVTEYCISCHNDETSFGDINYAQGLKPEEYNKFADAIISKSMPPGNPLEKIKVEIIQAWKEKGFSDESFDHSSVGACNELENSIGMESYDCQEGEDAPLDQRVWRLTSDQYLNTVSFVFKNKIRDLDPIQGDEKLGIADNNQKTLTVTRSKLFTIRSNANLIGQQVLEMSRAGDLDIGAATPNCTFSDDSCKLQIIESIAEVAFRGKNSDRMNKILAEYYTNSPQARGQAFKNTIALIFQMPQFLYRQEFSQNGNDELSTASLIESLAYTLWNFPPDHNLMEKAKTKDLSEEDLKTLIKEMLNDPKSNDLLFRMASPIFAVDEFSSIEGRMDVVDFSADLVQALETETRHFFSEVFQSETPTVSELFMNTSSVGHPDLDRIYGNTSDAGESIDLAGTGRLGLLTRAGFLTKMSHEDRSAVFERGSFIRERILCQPLPSPPDNVPALPETNDANATTFRDRFVAHRSQKACVSCHSMIDDIGFSMENFDWLGRYRDSYENNGIIEPEGKITQTVDINGEIKNIEDLSVKLASSNQVKQCFSFHFFRQVYGSEIQKQSQCEANRLAKALTDDNDLRQHILNILISKYFRTRQ